VCSNKKTIPVNSANLNVCVTYHYSLPITVYYDCKLVDISNVDIKYLLWQSITENIWVWHGNEFRSNLFNINTNSTTNSRV